MAIGFGVVLVAVAAGASIAVLIRPGTDPAAASTLLPSASASASPSEAPSPSTAAPTASPVPTPVPNPPLANRAIADVHVDQLNVRKAGAESAEVLGQLRAGARVFVIGSPATEGDTYWYRIAVVSGAYTGTDDCPMAPCFMGLGYVASPRTGDPWLEEVEIGCPSSPMTVADLSRLQPLEQLHCYGNQEIVVTGTVSWPYGDYVGAVVFQPAWLARPEGAAYFLDVPQNLIWFRSDPADALEPPQGGDVIRAAAHFDDPASPSCRARVNQDGSYEGIDPSIIPTTEVVVLACRTQLVITEYEVTDHKDLGASQG